MPSKQPALLVAERTTVNTGNVIPTVVLRAFLTVLHHHLEYHLLYCTKISLGLVKYCKQPGFLIVVCFMEIAICLF